ncbi:MAG: 5-formyltetrahydrofolate cyclo-ligase [Balneolaceae bacterium]|nr:5-formyltetrahydrofolate cyclo-ligase [Balneolaceae bacterium]
MDKQALRKLYLRKRADLSIDFVKANSQKIAQHLFTLEEFKKADIVHCYASIKENSEVETDLILDFCLNNGKELVMPKVLSKVEMKHVGVSSITGFKENRWGVKEPVDGKSVQADYPDLIVVPMVAGDWQKNRLGYGKGYYDRFLSRTKGLKVGILFDFQLHNVNLPVEDFDVPLDILITENEIIR